MNGGVETALVIGATSDIGHAIVHTLVLLAAIDAITHAHGGRVYLAKDACCAPERVRQGYPQRDAFKAVRTEAVGETPRFASALSRRLAL